MIFKMRKNTYSVSMIQAAVNRIKRHSNCGICILR